MAGSCVGPRAEKAEEGPHLENSQVFKPIFCARHWQNPEEEAGDHEIGKWHQDIQSLCGECSTSVEAPLHRAQWVNQDLEEFPAR